MENGGSGIVPDGAKSNIKKSKPNAFLRIERAILERVVMLRRININKVRELRENSLMKDMNMKQGKREGTMLLSMTNKEAMMEEKAMIGSKEIRKRVTEIKGMGMRGGREATILSLLKLLIL